MKKATMAMLSLTSFAAFAGMAGAVPYGMSDLATGNERSELASNGQMGSSQRAADGATNGTNRGPVAWNNSSLNVPTPAPFVQTVPESGSTLLLVGAGLLGLGMLYRGWRVRA